VKCMHCQNRCGDGDVDNVCSACRVKLARWTTTETTTYGTFGWECPRCHACHAPFVEHCDCPGARRPGNGTAHVRDRSEAEGT